MDSFRNGKHCRERWINHLDPSVKKGSWTLTEERILLSEGVNLGRKWARIMKHLPGRTENAVKNRWNQMIEKKRQELLKGLYAQ